MFSQVSVCPMGGGVYTPPPQADTLPWADTPARQTPPGQTHPHQADPPLRDGGRYTSYWNAFLFIVIKTYFKGRKGATFARNFTNTLNLVLKMQLETLDSLDIYFQTALFRGDELLLQGFEGPCFSGVSHSELIESFTCDTTSLNRYFISCGCSLHQTSRYIKQVEAFLLISI